MTTLFLSYSSKDETRVAEIRDAIEAAGIPCWMARRDLPPGSAYDEIIPAVIEGAEAVAVFLSAASIASPEVAKEVGLASKKHFFPVRLDDVSPEDLKGKLKYHLSDSQWVDARTNWKSAAEAVAKAVHDAQTAATALRAEETDLSGTMARSPAEWYESRRNGLLTLLNEATALDLPEKYADELRQTARKCQEDSFEIALVGEFQGGKSTTFNALCNGRDISPRGLGGGGIKTSAAVISAQNIAGEETRDGLSEWAEVTFKSPGAVALGLSTILRRPLMDSEAFRAFNGTLSDEAFAEALATDDGFPSLVRLDDPDCRRILLDAADVLWSQWDANHSSLSDDDLDQLRIATLQLQFYGTDEYRQMVSQTILPIDKFQKLIAFPKDWMTRWTGGRRAEFSLEEVAFVFVHAVLVRLHSENLRRLGCRITDCPGLFANAYDTSVARRTILNADAVWYLVNGEKQIGQKDLEIVRSIAAMGMLGKIEATCNLRGPHEQKIADIIPATKAALANAGHAIEVYPYNARLAFLATQGDLLVNRPALFSELDRACMVIDAKVKDANSSPASMWAKMVRRTGGSAELEDLEDIDTLDAESVAVVRRESMLDGILSRLETDIIPQKARSILVDKGSDRAARALVAYEGVLKATEEAAAAEEGKWRSEVEHARTVLEDFVDRANVAIDRSALHTERDALAADMAREVADMAFDEKFANELATRIGKVVKTRYKKFYFFKSSLRQDLMADIAPIVSDSARSTLTNALDKFQKSKNAESKKVLKRRIDSLVGNLQDIWESKSLNVSALSTFSVPVLDADIVSEFGETAFGEIFTEKDIGSIRMEGILGGLGSVLKFVFKLICSLGVSLILLSLGMNPSASGTAGRGTLSWLMSKKKDDNPEADDEKLGKIASAIKPKLMESFANPEFRKNVEESLALGFRDSLKGIVHKVRDSLETLKADFEKERIAEPEKMFGKSVAERQRIAKENKAIRTKTIEPLRKRIEAFKCAVVAELAN